jgi:hypothetical protein
MLYYSRQPVFTHSICMTFTFLNIGLRSNFISYIIDLKLIIFMFYLCISSLKLLNFLRVQIIVFIVIDAQVSLLNCTSNLRNILRNFEVVLMGIILLRCK